MNVNEIIEHVLNGKRTVKEAVRYMETNSTDQQQTNEAIVCNLLKDAIKLGGANDLNFERVFR